MRAKFGKVGSGYEVTFSDLTYSQLQIIVEHASDLCFLPPEKQEKPAPPKVYYLAGFLSREENGQTVSNKPRVARLIMRLTGCGIKEARCEVEALSWKAFLYKPVPYPYVGLTLEEILVFRELWPYLEWDGEVPPCPF